MTTYQQPPKRGMPRWLIALIIVAGILILGCGGCIVSCGLLARKGVEAGAKKAEEISKQIQVEMEKEQKAQEARRRAGAAPVEGDDAPVGEATPSTTKLPNNFPAEIPIYSGFTPTFSLGNNNDNSGSVLFSGSGSPDTVAAYYKREMERKGWKLASETNVEETRAQTYTKDESTVMISVSPDSGTRKSILSINYNR